jgi:phosphatidylglycerophosphate synthase
VTEDPKRRPIASRRWRISQRLASYLAERRIAPNAISVAGMASGLLAGCLFAATSKYSALAPWFWLLGAVFVQLRLVANMLDGMVAMLTNTSSPVGELFNEVPDRVSDTTIFVGLGYAVGGEPVVGFAAALAAMFTAYVRTTCVSAGASPNFCGPMAKQHRMVAVTCLAVALLVVPADEALWQDVSHAVTPTNLALSIIIVGSVITAIRRLTASARQLRMSNSRK